MCIIFPAGTPYGEEHSQMFRTVYDYQREIDVKILQGNRSDPAGLHDNAVLTKTRVTVKPRPAGQTKIKVRMHVDMDGCLTVTVVDDDKLGR